MTCEDAHNASAGTGVGTCPVLGGMVLYGGQTAGEGWRRGPPARISLRGVATRRPRPARCGACPSALPLRGDAKGTRRRPGRGSLVRSNAPLMAAVQFALPLWVRVGMVSGRLRLQGIGRWCCRCRRRHRLRSAVGVTLGDVADGSGGNVVLFEELSVVIRTLL